MTHAIICKQKKNKKTTLVTCFLIFPRDPDVAQYGVFSNLPADFLFQLKRKQDVEKQKKSRKIEWMKKM